MHSIHVTCSSPFVSIHGVLHALAHPHHQQLHCSPREFSISHPLSCAHSLFILRVAQEWTCQIDEGSAGLTAARWSPDGRNVLTSCDFALRTTVWSLVSQQIHYLKVRHRRPSLCESLRAVAFQQTLDYSNSPPWRICHERARVHSTKVVLLILVTSSRRTL